MQLETEKVDAKDDSAIAIGKSVSVGESISVTGHYDVQCFDAEGNMKWSDTIKNLVVTVGKDDLLDKYFAGSAYSAAWYMGLVDNTSFSAYAAGDTLASHAGWLEFLSYTISGSSTNRATPSWSAASSGSKTTTATSFTITGSGSVLGALMCTTQARNTASNGGAGILYSAGSFTGGARTVASGDIILVTYTASV